MTTSQWEETVTIACSVSEAEQLEEKLNTFERLGNPWSYIVPNLREDRFLTDSAAKDFIEFFKLVEPSDDPDSLINLYTWVCNKNAYSGESIKVRPLPKYVGRAIEKEDFFVSLTRNNPCDIREMRELFSCYEAGIADDSQKEYLFSLIMSEWAVWVTWDEDTDGVGHPFQFEPRRCANFIRAALGLPKKNQLKDKPLLTLTYVPDGVGQLKKPTVADASHHLHFYCPPQPPPVKNDWYGMTRPWREVTGNEKLEDKLFPRRPEALHDKQAYFPETLSVTTLVNRRYKL